MYDLQGHLIGEYTNTGALIQETVWLNDLPIATIRPNSSGIAVYFIHADELGTSRVVTDTTQSSNDATQKHSEIGMKSLDDIYRCIVSPIAIIKAIIPCIYEILWVYTARHSNHSIVGYTRSPQAHSLSMLMGLSHLPPPCDSNGEQYITWFA